MALTLSIKTDNPRAEIGLHEGLQEISSLSWTADRELSATLHLSIKQLLEDKGKELSDVGGIAVFQGPGSFTGLRIGLCVANALAYALNVPITAGRGDDWITDALKNLEEGRGDKLVKPFYGAEPHITKPRK
ncbi:MAG TPA: tRNA (adenosine(37)-N6)-threonylcarbamoyltransferase complex dimerization subunit type 1 TsaB [Candidatus Saccharimonadales bacterium]|nr:tRNA (adenosine(37)-N6)-threonylcarbamoyltransferase complex dimerization subunit type 1 TsaB [Candidatus Saccharimonadales bacterium]